MTILFFVKLYINYMFNNYFKIKEEREAGKRRKERKRGWKEGREEGSNRKFSSHIKYV